jgi:two-component sensor histidine kinase
LQVNLDTVTALGMAAAELVTNCYVHGFPNGKSGTIDVLLSTSESGEGMLTIKDDGVGFDVTAENKRHGVGLVKQLILQMNGSGESGVLRNFGLGGKAEGFHFSDVLSFHDEFREDIG